MRRNEIHKKNSIFLITNVYDDPIIRKDLNQKNCLMTKLFAFNTFHVVLRGFSLEGRTQKGILISIIKVVSSSLPWLKYLYKQLRPNAITESEKSSTTLFILGPIGLICEVTRK